MITSMYLTRRFSRRSEQLIWRAPIVTGPARATVLPSPFRPVLRESAKQELN
jgi:hypothetical protein